MEKLKPGQYNTFDLIKHYQGFEARNEGKAVEDSWNASFGKILKQLSNDYPSKIQEIEAGVGKEDSGGRTTVSLWKVY